MKIFRGLKIGMLYSGVAVGWCLILSVAGAPVDPGVRPGPADAGVPLAGLTTDELNAFTLAQDIFEEVDSVDGSIPGEDDSGLGPTFNLNSCSGCHAFPAIGGASPSTNPQIAIATLHGAQNVVPSFITINGPIREARFKRNSDGTPDGGVHSLFVITGRSDAPPGFNLAQTNFAPQIAANNLSFRIPTSLFGAGLIEAIPDAVILNNQTGSASTRATLGIAGRPNRSSNDGTIMRFGWKAQNKSLLMFSGEAYQVEQGITNELFPNPRELGQQVLTSASPESAIELETEGIGDIEQFMIFMRLLDAPKTRTPPTANRGSVVAGENHFEKIGCVLCHTTSLTTGVSSIAALTNQPVPLFSDLLLHKMGRGLADDISQGLAASDEFRTAPLWGLGKRIFLLHDGRTTNLEQAILAHSSPATSPFAPSEANQVVQNYLNLNDTQKQNVLNFLRSL